MSILMDHVQENHQPETPWPKLQVLEGTRPMLRWCGVIIMLIATGSHRDIGSWSLAQRLRRCFMATIEPHCPLPPIDPSGWASVDVVACSASSQAALDKLGIIEIVILMGRVTRMKATHGEPRMGVNRAQNMAKTQSICWFCLVF